MKNIVRFKGSFKDLIPNGWTFQKLFGRNYRSYRKTCNGEKYGQDCIIWQHLGGYLEIDDLFSNSWIIVQKIKDGSIEDCKHMLPNYLSPNKELEPYYPFILDTDTNIFYSYKSPEYKQIYGFLNGFTNTTPRKEFVNRYRSWNMYPDMIPMIQDLLNKQWIDIEDVSNNPKFSR